MLLPSIIVLLVIIAVLYLAISAFFILRIRRANDVRIALNARMHLRAGRRILLLCFFVLAVVLGFIIIAFFERRFFVEWLVMSSLFGFYVFQFIKTGRIKELMAYCGTISSESLPIFLDSHGRFALFLRGFEDDVYHHQSRIKIDHFSEVYLARAVERGLNMPLCALGHPLEAESPEGAIRLYVNHENWKDGVLSLMSKAEKVFILVNDRSSCIWEIVMSERFKDKCVFLVTNISKYRNAVSSLPDGFSFFKQPFLDNAVEADLPCYFSINKPAKKFKGGFLAYNDMTDVNPPVSLAKKRRAKGFDFAEYVLFYYTIITIIMLVYILFLLIW